MQFFKPEYYFEVREALIQAGRADLIARRGRQSRPDASTRTRPCAMTTTTRSPTPRRARDRASARRRRWCRTRAIGPAARPRPPGTGTTAGQPPRAANTEGTVDLLVGLLAPVGATAIVALLGWGVRRHFRFRRPLRVSAARREELRELAQRIDRRTLIPVFLMLFGCPAVVTVVL